MLKTMFWKYHSPKTRASLRVLELGFVGDDSDEEVVEDAGGLGR